MTHTPRIALVVIAAVTVALVIGLAGGAASAAELSFAKRLAWQIALEQHALSPGIIDGKIGSKTLLATREFQKVRGLPITGDLDDATARALGVKPESATTTYTILQADADMVVPPPKTWIEKAKARILGYDSLLSAVAEKFHCSRDLLVQLNPKLAMNKLSAGDTLNVPFVGPPTAPRGQSIELNLSEKVIRVLDEDQHLVGLFHCSIAAKQEKRPSGSATVVTISHNPTYVFDPKMWPEVKTVDHKLLIPPGPRNPVGLCWIGLSLPGYGIHGTPNPEMIGKTGSHGCFRLTNWDALRLSRMIQTGTPVRFVEQPSDAVASAGR